MRILMIEDDMELCDAVCYELTKSGYTVDCLQDGEDAFYYLDRASYDILILDRMLPGRDGLSILNELRRQGFLMPVIMVTAMDSIQDRIDGLDCGADDYLVKPFATGELLARIRALSRRPKAPSDTEVLRFSDLLLDSTNLCLKSGTQAFILSKRENDLLEYLIKNSGITLSRERILSHVWGPDHFVENGNLDNYIHFLRRRLTALNSRARIQTVRGVGYRLEELE